MGAAVCKHSDVSTHKLDMAVASTRLCGNKRRATPLHDQHQHKHKHKHKHMQSPPPPPPTQIPCGWGCVDAAVGADAAEAIAMYGFAASPSTGCVSAAAAGDGVEKVGVPPDDLGAPQLGLDVPATATCNISAHGTCMTPERVRGSGGGNRRQGSKLRVHFHTHTHTGTQRTGLAILFCWSCACRHVCLDLGQRVLNLRARANRNIIKHVSTHTSTHGTGPTRWDS